MHRKLIPLLLGLCLAAGFPASALDLVKDGKPVATIVVASPTQPPAETGRAARRAKRRATRRAAGDSNEAATVLADWVKKITDVELPIRAAPVDGTIPIYIGSAAVQTGLKLDDIDSPSHEGLRIVADNRRVLIAGQNDTATLKAVTRFLESLGCRYFMDGPLGEVYPRSRTLSTGPLSLAESPSLLARNPKGPSWRPPLWKTWNGAGGEPFEHQHAWKHYVSTGLFASHPEYFAMAADGHRKQGDWLCTSNPDLRKYFADQVIATIRSGTRNPSISPPDGRGYCQCSTCKAQDDPKSLEPSTGVVSLSNRYADFFDDVARRVAAVYPDSVLSFYCYADYTQPPTTKRKLSPNLCAVIAPIRYCRLHEIGHAGCPSREQEVSMIAGWAAVASRLGYYNYMYNLADGTLPFFKFTACQKEFPYLKNAGLCNMTIEVLSNWQIYGPQIYLSLRLAYDPKADATAIMEDYWQKFYGPRAAPFMKQYWLGIDAELGRLNSHAGGFAGLQQIYTVEFLQRCETLLTKAADAARGNPAYEQRVALHTEGFQSAVEYRRISDAMNLGDFAQAQKIYDQAVSRLRTLPAKGWANPKYATAYLERFLGPTLKQGVAATAPPNRVTQILPDRWRFTVDGLDRGLANHYHYPAPDFDDAKWPLVCTYSKTLDTQGFDQTAVLWYRTKFNVPASHGKLALFIPDVDGFTDVFVNGQPLAPATAAAPAKPGRDTDQPHSANAARPRAPFQVDVTPALNSGENLLALRVDHTKITDLSLGGILRPILLLERPK